MRRGNLFGLGSLLVEHTGSESAVLLFGRGSTGVQRLAMHAGMYVWRRTLVWVQFPLEPTSGG